MSVKLFTNNLFIENYYFVRECICSWLIIHIVCHITSINNDILYVSIFLQVLIICSLTLLAAGVDSLTIPSFDFGNEENENLQPIKDKNPISSIQKYTGTRWGRSIIPEDSNIDENQQEIHKKAPSSSLSSSSSSSRQRYSGTRWGK